MEKSLNSLIGKFPVIMITGPRQVGKTTLLNHLTKSYKEKINYISLDNLLARQLVQEDPELFLRSHESPLIIDEFQDAPNLLTYIKIKVDEARKNAMFENQSEVGTLYYLTGFQIFETMNNVSESLAGRIGILDLYGFSTRVLNELQEDIFLPDINILKKKEKLNTISTKKVFERIITGSYPEAINLDDTTREKFYETYIRTYLERDVRQLIN